MANSEKLDYLLQHLTSLLARNADQILLEQLGIGYSQFKILRVIGSELSFTQRQIADHLGQTEASISRQIKLLIKKGLISKFVDPKNKRARLIKITGKGLKLTEASLVALDKYYVNVLSEFNDKKQVELSALLDDFHKSICNFEHSTNIDYIGYISNN